MPTAPQAHYLYITAYCAKRTTLYLMPIAEGITLFLFLFAYLWNKTPAPRMAR
jgi:hypothetical protein